MCVADVVPPSCVRRRCPSTSRREWVASLSEFERGFGRGICKPEHVRLTTQEVARVVYVCIVAANVTVRIPWKSAEKRPMLLNARRLVAKYAQITAG